MSGISRVMKMSLEGRGKPGKAILYWNTLKYLKPVQIRYQIVNRIWGGGKRYRHGGDKEFRAPKNREEIRLLIPELDCDPGYLRRFSVNGLTEDRVELLHESHSLENGWIVSDASRLWNYNLQYMEFMIPLAQAYKNTGEEKYFLKWKELAESWLAQSDDVGFEPYPISMRIPNLLICMELLKERLAGTETQTRLFDSVYCQYRFLLRAQERALLANHYFENLKTIVISALLFRQRDVYHRYFDLFLKEIDEQILPDGLHFERSPMYHKIILEDLLRVYAALNGVGHSLDGEKLIPAIRAMTSAMVKVERGFSRTPLFNDAGDNVSKNKDALARAVERLCGEENRDRENDGSLTVFDSFQAAGYFRFDRGKTALLFDCGEIGPSYMGGHAHCDCLSFECGVNGEEIFVNSGTGLYQGELRPFFRSTAAHNTVMIDDREQSELWGEHRAARRIRKVRCKRIGDFLVGQFESFRGDRFRRSLRWRDDKTLVITDTLKACDGGDHMARQFLHLAPGFCYRQAEGQINVMEGERLRGVIRLPEGCDSLIHREGPLTTYAEEFGAYRKKQALEILTPFRDKIRLRMEIEISLA